MTPGVWQLVGTLLIQIVIGAFVYGRLTERVNNVTDDVKELRATAKDHAVDIKGLDGRVSHLEGRRHSGGSL